MGTKNAPGAYDCYAAAQPDEPMFVLLGRDPMAWLLVSLWATMRSCSGDDDAAKVAEACDCAAAMQKWALNLGKRDKVAEACELFEAAARVINRQIQETRIRKTVAAEVDAPLAEKVGEPVRPAQ